MAVPFSIPIRPADRGHLGAAGRRLAGRRGQRFKPVGRLSERFLNIPQEPIKLLALIKQMKLVAFLQQYNYKENNYLIII